MKKTQNSQRKKSICYRSYFSYYQYKNKAHNVSGLILIITAIGVAAIAFFICLKAYTVSLSVVPSPDNTGIYDSEGFPEVDWSHWSNINPDIVGWVTVPDTNIDYPLVLAPQENPQFYLDHDIYKNWSWLGWPYLDADCSEHGLQSLNSIIFGHNTGWDSAMFADFAFFSDPAYAEGHREILLQTPQWKQRLTVVAVDVIDGEEQSKQTQFNDESSFYLWYKLRYDESRIMIEEAFPLKKLYTFVTCSYNASADERTLIYAKLLA